MSTATAAPERSRQAPPPTPRDSRRTLFAQLAAGLLVVALLTITTVVLLPASEADKAREDGERLGLAVSDLYYADSSAEVDDALDEIHDAAADSVDHAGDAVAEQVAAQEDALERAVDGYAGAVSADDAFESDLYEAELDTAIDDLESQAADFRENAPEVEEAFWEGFEEGLPDD